MTIRCDGSLSATLSPMEVHCLIDILNTSAAFPFHFDSRHRSLALFGSWNALFLSLVWFCCNKRLRTHTKVMKFSNVLLRCRVGRSELVTKAVVFPAEAFRLRLQSFEFLVLVLQVTLERSDFS